MIDSSTDATKLDVVRHYASVGTLMMEHLAGRPVSLVRYPQGIKRQGFFQKHLERASLEGVRQLDPRLDPDHPPLIEVAEPVGLVSAAQMNVIEFHTWNALKTHIDKPDRITLDLDPGTGVEWSTMQKVAELLQSLLTELDLPAFLKTSGGKGLHVVTPIRRQYDWDTVKDFSRAIVEHLARTLSEAGGGEKRREEPSRQDLHRLPAQWVWRHDGVRMVGTRAPGARRLRPGFLGRARDSEERGAVDSAQCWRPAGDR